MLTLTPTEHAQLLALPKPTARARGCVLRAQILLLSAAGEANTAIARDFRGEPPLVTH